MFGIDLEAPVEGTRRPMAPGVPLLSDVWLREIGEFLLALIAR